LTFAWFDSFDLAAINVIQHEGKNIDWLRDQIPSRSSSLTLDNSPRLLLKQRIIFILVFSFCSDNSQQQSQSYVNEINTSTLRASGHVIQDERFGNEILARAGPSHTYQHPQYRTQEGRN